MSVAKCLLNGKMLTTWKAYEILLNWAKIIHTHYSVQFSRSVMSDSLWPHGLQHTRLPCPSPTPGANSNSCLSSWWCHPTISPCVVLFSSCLQSCPASGSSPMSQLFFASGGQSIGVSASASVLPMNIQDWFPLGLTGWINTIIIIHYYLTIILGLEKHWSKRMTRRSIYMYYLLEKY